MRFPVGRIRLKLGYGKFRDGISLSRNEGGMEIEIDGDYICDEEELSSLYCALQVYDCIMVHVITFNACLYLVFVIEIGCWK